MNSTPPKMLVMAGANCACIKIVGRANFTLSVDFKALVGALQPRGIGYLILDLSECSLMDSTFLGVLAGLGLQGSGTHASKPGVQIELYNPNPRITELLDNLGVIHLFRISSGSLNLPEATMDPQPVQPGAHSKETVARACLEAHELLMEINPANLAKFKDVARFFAEDLKKIQSEPGDSQSKL